MIETLVYSWWSAPRGVPDADLTTLARLSVLASGRHFKRTLLITDTPGAAWAARELPGLFDAVSTALDSLPASLARIWALGKLFAATQMDTPFVHLDLDAFLWSPLPARLLEAAVCAERPAPIEAGDVRTLLASVPAPAPWLSALETPSPRQLCGGLFGGHDLTTIHTWARASLLLAEAGRGFPSLSGMRASVVLEQFGLAAFAPSAETLFTCEQPDELECRRIGYTHLVGAEKRNPAMLARARERLARQEFAPKPWTSLAAVAAVYPSRDNPRVANVALEKSAWDRVPQLSELPSSTLWPVGMVAGGCTAWNVPVLHRMLPLQIAPRLGWDGHLCVRLNQAGYRLLLATDIRCEHLCMS